MYRNAPAMLAVLLTLAAPGAFAAGAIAASNPQPLQQAYAPPIDRAGQPYTDALNLLEANGYTGIADFRAEGQQFAATAMHDGRRVSVLVDPATRHIQPQT